MGFQKRFVRTVSRGSLVLGFRLQGSGNSPSELYGFCSGYSGYTVGFGV